MVNPHMRELGGVRRHISGSKLRIVILVSPRSRTPMQSALLSQNTASINLHSARRRYTCVRTPSRRDAHAAHHRIHDVRAGRPHPR